jgi:hypothetical protein
MSVTITLEDERDISRGDMLVHPHSQPLLARHLEANIVWMNDEPLTIGRNFLLKHTSQQVTVRVPYIESRLDINSMERKPATSLALNDIGTVQIEASRPIFFDSYRDSRLTGAFILIDPLTNATVGAGMISSSLERKHQKLAHVAPDERRTRNGHGPALLTLSRTSLALRLERRLFDHGCQVFSTDPTGHENALLSAGLIIIAPRSIHEGAISLDSLPLPKDEEAAVDAMMAFLEQQGILNSDRFASGEGI